MNPIHLQENTIVLLISGLITLLGIMIKIWRKAVIIVPAMLFVIVLIFAFLRFVVPGEAPVTTVEMTSPAEGGQVDIDTMVKGTYLKFPKDASLWILVYSHTASRFYPQNEPATIEAGGGWSSRCLIGVPTDKGQKFDLVAVLADMEGQAAIRGYLTQAARDKSWPGMIQLPAGAAIFQRLTVVRR